MKANLPSNHYFLEKGGELCKVIFFIEKGGGEAITLPLHRIPLLEMSSLTRFFKVLF